MRSIPTLLIALALVAVHLHAKYTAREWEHFTAGAALAAAVLGGVGHLVEQSRARRRRHRRSVLKVFGEAREENHYWRPF